MIIFNTISLGTHNTNKMVKVIISGNNFVRVHFVLFVCLDSLHSSQQLFSHIGT